MVKGLLISLLLLVGIAVASLFLLQEPGRVLLTYGDLSIEFSLILFAALAAIVFVLAYILLRLLVHLVRIPTDLANFNRRQGEKHSTDDLGRGMLELAKGYWDKADHYLSRSARRGRRPALNYLYAAKAAHMQHDYVRRDGYLRMAHETEAGADFATHLVQAECQLNDQQNEQALALLNQLHEQAPKHGYVLSLLATGYRRLGDWDRLARLLPALHRTRTLKDGEIAELERAAVLGRMHNARQRRDAAELQSIWSQATREMQVDETVIAAYARYLMELEQHDAAESVLRKALDDRWSEALAYAYGRVRAAEPNQSLNHAETWLETRKDSAILLLTLGRLCSQAKLWGKARNYFETSLASKPMAETYAELAALLDQLGENEAGQACTRKGLSVAVEQPGVDERRIGYSTGTELTQPIAAH